MIRIRNLGLKIKEEVLGLNFSDKENLTEEIVFLSCAGSGFVFNY